MAQTKANYTVDILVQKSLSEVFSAINNVQGWWIGDIHGATNKVGSEFTYRYKEFHDTTQKVTELIPNQKIVWLVTKSKINFVKNKNEWLGTEIAFDLKAEGDATRVSFTHSGLTPAIECYDGCSGGWDFYIQKSLKSFIETGKGIAPNF